MTDPDRARLEGLNPDDLRHLADLVEANGWAHARRSAWEEENDRLREQADPETTAAYVRLVEAEGSEVLLDVLEMFLEYVAFPSLEAAWATTLWVAHTHFAWSQESTPRLALVSPEPQCGKTRTLEICELVSARAFSAVNTSVAAMFRLVESERPTLLFDEADTYFGPRAREHEELRGLINAGHRKGTMAFRCVGDPKKMEVRAFPAYCPVALACIGDLPATIFDRAVIIRMRRRRKDEKVRPFRQRRAGAAGEALRDRLHSWAASNGERAGALEPILPDWLTDRPADVWEPLIAIADLAGGAWPEWARQAARAIEAERRTAEVSLGIRLLTDIHTVTGDEEKIPTNTLLERLNNLDEAPWGDLRGKALDARGLARRLSRYGIGPKPFRTDSGVTKGYELADFRDAFGRYLSLARGSVTSVTSVTKQDAEGGLVPDVTDVTDTRGRQRPDSEQRRADD